MICFYLPHTHPLMMHALLQTSASFFFPVFSITYLQNFSCFNHSFLGFYTGIYSKRFSLRSRRRQSRGIQSKGGNRKESHWEALSAIGYPSSSVSYTPTLHYLLIYQKKPIDYHHLC
ncbi:unnamed protein product [Kuraishia capsulata CBS 1993]|uniref:Uncharacterized protein n=1 Tax=Kuraishia capsulata CBS 1993 TaxID=1382522 RepID=W6ML32_9ASCO|nr:uncharacterized protein KUCA_T00002772001 [Kuraishia capsulata CBS 1993]CDK26798.1 unnamed protein product [Kuraishia capsulata CBS 1993]